MPETPQHFLQESVNFKPCLQHKHVMVLHPVVQLQRIILSWFGDASGSVIVTGIILPFKKKIPNQVGRYFHHSIAVFNVRLDMSETWQHLTLMVAFQV